MQPQTSIYEVNFFWGSRAARWPATLFLPTIWNHGEVAPPYFCFNPTGFQKKGPKIALSRDFCHNGICPKSVGPLNLTPSQCTAYKTLVVPDFFLNVIVRARIVVIYPNKYWSITKRAMLRPLIDKNSTSFLELFDELIFLEGSLVTPDVTFT